MQDFQPIPGLAGRLFGGSTGRPRGGYLIGGIGTAAAEVVSAGPAKCPRCESTNTKFCYYNNYNLSQPRHYCKGCRRYWTKGGILRNVPVGGGCRKKQPSKKNKRGSKSVSSPNSSVTNNGAAADAAGTSEIVSNDDAEPINNDSSSPPPVIEDSSNPDDALLAASFDAQQFVPPPAMFAEQNIAEQELALSSLLSSAPPAPFPKAAAADPVAEERKVVAFGDQTTVGEVASTPFHVGRYGGACGNSNFVGGMDHWLPVMVTAADPVVFDFTGAFDPAVHWSQNGWVDADPTLYLP